MYRDTWLGRGQSLLRVRSEVFEEIVDAALYGVGAIRKRGIRMRDMLVLRLAVEPA